MSKTWIILKNEFITTVSRKSFILTLLLVPAVSAIISLVIGVLGNDTSQVISQVFEAPPTQLVEGYIDQSGLIQTSQADLPDGRFIPYTDINTARAALAEGEISGYYVVQPDYLQTGNVTYVRSDFNPLTGFGESDLFESLLRYNLLGQNPELADRITQPLDIEFINQNPEPQREEGNMLTFFLPYIVTMMFYVVILSAASLMLSSMTKEKENRVLEILMNSVTPTQLLAGKILALGLVGLLQTLVWTGAGLALLRLSGNSLDLSAAFQLPISILAWGAVFFILGYALYASLMAGVGALAPNLRESSQATTIMVMPMVVPLIVLSAIVNEPQGALAVGLSLFPFTAPVTMMTRLSIGAVPGWQLILAVAILVFTALLAIRAVAAMFRAQTLLSGQTFSLKLFAQALMGRA